MTTEQISMKFGTRESTPKLSENLILV